MCSRSWLIPSNNLENILFGKVLVFPSLCSYAYTGMLIDYKWMSHSTSTKELILKYYIRGCCIILNENEHIAIKKYINENIEKWGILIEYLNEEKYVSINNPIFKPRTYLHGFYSNILKYSKIISVNNYAYVINHPDANIINSSIIKKSEIKLILRFATGNINPIYLWQDTILYIPIKKN